MIGKYICTNKYTLRTFTCMYLYTILMFNKQYKLKSTSIENVSSCNRLIFIGILELNNTFVYQWSIFIQIHCRPNHIIDIFTTFSISPEVVHFVDTKRVVKRRVTCDAVPAQFKACLNERFQWLFHSNIIICIVFPIVLKNSNKTQCSLHQT